MQRASLHWSWNKSGFRMKTWGFSRSSLIIFCREIKDKWTIPFTSFFSLQSERQRMLLFLPIYVVGCRVLAASANENGPYYYSSSFWQIQPILSATLFCFCYSCSLKVLEQQQTGYYENVELVNGGPLISLHIIELENH